MRPFVVPELVLAFAATLLLPSSAAGQAAPLRWSDGLNWPGNIVPGIGGAVGAPVVIQPGTTFLLDLPHVILDELDVQGGLVFEDNGSRTLTADRIRVTGRLEIGTQANPFKNDARIELRSQFPSTTLSLPISDGSLQAIGAATVEMFGLPKGPTWARLASNAAMGNAAITLDAPIQWKSGDSIVIASTDFSTNESEVHQVFSIDVTQRIVTLMQPLQHDHRGTTEGASFDGVGVEIRAEVGLLTHNVVIEGVPPATPGQARGGQTRFEADAQGIAPLVQIEAVEFVHLGRDATMGEYPLHFHAMPANPSTSVNAAGSYVMNSSIHDCFNRFVSVHHTSNVILAHNVASETIGHGFYFEDSTVAGCQVIRNLGLNVRVVPSGGLHEDDHASVFWLNSPDNMVIENAAAGSEWAGFWFDRVDEPFDQLPWQEFRGNVAHSNFQFGFFSDWRPRPATESVISDCLAYKNRNTGLWFRSYEHMRLVNCDASDNRAGLYFASAGYQVDQNGRDGLSRIVLQDSLIIGESGAFTAPPETHVNQPCSGRPTMNMLVGIELYDGLVGLENCVFAEFRDRQINGNLRKGAAISQIAEFNMWAVDPRNYISDCSFVNTATTVTQPVFLRQPQGLINFCFGPPRGDAGLANTIFHVRQGCLGSGCNPASDPVTGDYIVANNPFLLPSPPASVVPFPGANAFAVTGTRYGQLDLNLGDALPASLHGLAVPVPPTAAVSVQFTSLQRSSFFDSVGAIATLPAGGFSRIPRYHTNAVVNDGYRVTYPSGYLPDYFELTFQDAAPGDWTVVGVPLRFPTTTFRVDYNGVQANALLVQDFNAVVAGAGGSFTYDFATGRIWMKLVLESNGSGGTIYDSLSSTFRVLVQ